MLPNFLDASLYTKMGAGALGGQIFSRLCDQLLLADAAANGYDFRSPSDRAGDYKKLDAYSIRTNNGNFCGEFSKVGFQYKFFPSEVADLTAKHKREIAASLGEAFRENSDMTCWVLVTPEDFNRHQQAWYEGLLDEVKQDVFKTTLEQQETANGLKSESEKASQEELEIRANAIVDKNFSLQILHWGQKEISHLMRHRPDLRIGFFGPKTANSVHFKLEVYCQNLIANINTDSTQGDRHIDIRLDEGGNVDDALASFVTDGSSLFFGLLGEFGTGKSTALRKLAATEAKRYLTGQTTRCPLLIPLRLVRGPNTFEQNLLGFFKKQYGLELDALEFASLMSNKEATLILDGLDEKADGAERRRSRIRLQEVFDLLVPGVKVVVSSRSEFFHNALQERQAMLGSLRSEFIAQQDGETRSRDTRARISYLELLSAEQRKWYFCRRFGNDDGNKINESISQVYDLKDLALRPVLLDMVCETIQNALGDGRFNKVSRFTSADLYGDYTDRHMRTDVIADRVKQDLSKKRRLISRLAKHMTNMQEHEVHYCRIPEILGLPEEDVFDSFLDTSFLMGMSH